MIRILFLLLSLVPLSLEAIHYQNSITATPLSHNEYLVDMQLEKVVDANSSPKLIASPKLICTAGELAELSIESEDHSDLLSIKCFIPNTPDQKSLHTTLLMKEKGEIVLSFDNVLKLNLAQ